VVPAKAADLVMPWRRSFRCMTGPASMWGLRPVMAGDARRVVQFDDGSIVFAKRSSSKGLPRGVALGRWGPPHQGRTGGLPMGS
jgi:hypothetical protein